VIPIFRRPDDGPLIGPVVSWGNLFDRARRADVVVAKARGLSAEESAMTTRGGIAIALVVGLGMTPARAQAPAPGDEVKNSFHLARLGLRNLAAAVRARLDEAEAGLPRLRESRQRLMDQKTAVADAEMAYRQAQLTADFAQIRVKEYEEGTFKRELATVEGNVAMARAELKREEDAIESANGHVEEAKALVARIGTLNVATPSDMLAAYNAGQIQRLAEARAMAAKFGVQKAKFGLEQAEVSRDVLVKYTKEKRLHELHAEVEKAASIAVRKKAEILLAQDTQARLEREAKDIDVDIAARPLSPAEKAALKKFAALGPSWKASLARRDSIEKDDAATRDESKRMLDDFTKALRDAESAWSSAREARLDDAATATLSRAR
jgi:hypothetical protein